MHIILQRAPDRGLAALVLPREGAPGASDRLAPTRSATPSATRHRLLQDAENFGEEGSWPLPPRSAKLLHRPMTIL